MTRTELEALKTVKDYAAACECKNGSVSVKLSDAIAIVEGMIRHEASVQHADDLMNALPRYPRYEYKQNQSLR